MADDIITISAPNTDTRTASGTDVFFTTQYPFMKLDATNDVSFQTISILFNNEPPQPSAFNYTSTLLYSFEHGYSYVPSIWFMWQNPNPEIPDTPPVGSSNTTYYYFGDDTVGNMLFYDENTVLTTDTVRQSPGPFAVVEYNDSILGPKPSADASIVAKVDDTKVYLYLLKQSLATLSGVPFGINVQGFSVNIRCYVFVEDVGI